MVGFDFIGVIGEAYMLAAIKDSILSLSPTKKKEYQ